MSKHHKYLGAADRRRAHRSLARRLNYVGPQTILGLEPPTMVVDEADIADGAAANLRCQFGDFVIGDFRRGIENVEGAKSRQSLAWRGRNPDGRREV
jgi:hypothetical protein